MDYLRNGLVLTCAFVLVLLALSRSLSAASREVWQIGTFDQSSHEFNHRAPFGNANYHSVFTVGKSAVKDWPSRQPGSENNDAGLRSHPITIVFNLASPPKGTYRLKISALLYNPRTPHLQVSINGKTGNYYFHPELSYYPGDPAFWSPTYAGDEITIVLPASALRSGENKLILTALDNPQDGPGESWLTYDALRLTQDPSEKAAASPRITARPTIFYVQKDGGVEELIRVTATLGRKVRQGSVRLSLDQQHYD
ncbi:MAG TPA: polysaccharide lyase family protein, partial [Terriglobia bacterium]|nr:polysaccharide lyase family protein [Terriglobia bacterium]